MAKQDIQGIAALPQELLHPGTYFFERQGQPITVGVGTSTGGFVGRFKKGPTDRAVFISSWSHFVSIFGGFYKGWLCPYSVRGFFDNSGTRIYVGRIVGTGAAAATKNLKDYGESNDTIQIDAQNVGDWGNSGFITTQKYSTTTAEALNSDATELELTNIPDGMERGDLLHIDDGTNTVQLYIQDINLTTKKITFIDVATITMVASGATVICSTTHKGSTLTDEDLVNGATSLALKNARNFNVGSRVYVDDGTTAVELLVTNTSGNTIYFDAVTLGVTITSGATCVTQEFNILIREGEDIVEHHQFLSLEDTNEVDFVEKRLSGQNNESIFIEVTDLDSVTSEPSKQIPFPVLNQPLAGGLDGATPTDNDYIGSAVEGSKTGIYLFDAVEGVRFLSVSGVTTVQVEQALADYCENRKDMIDVLDLPLAADTVQEALEFKNFTLNKDSSYAALYGPWLVVRDPSVSGGTIIVPPSGHVQGVMSRVAEERGVHKAPANERLAGVLDLTAAWGDREQDVLNPEGVNVIRAFPGEGIKVYGARTLWSTKDGRHMVHKRLSLIFIQQSVVQSNRWAVFEPNEEMLWEKMKNSIDPFLRNAWRGGMLYPRTNINRAFFVKCDEETNPTEAVNLGILLTEIGVNIVGAAEFVVFRTGLWDGGYSIEEYIMGT